MKLHIFKRTLLAIVLTVAVSIAVQAQEKLFVDQIFQRYGRAKGCKMVVMSNAKLRGYNLKVYKSLIYKNRTAEIAQLLQADKKRAKKVREVMESGRLVSGYYMMSPLSRNQNRYILFSYVGGNKGTVIYIEGDLSPDDIMKLCYSKW